MTTVDSQTLSLWFSPNFPTGGFSYSHGLDALYGSAIKDIDELRAALLLILHQGGARNDAIFLQLAMKGGDFGKLNSYCRAFAAGFERWEETIAQGTNFAKAVREVHGLELKIGAYPLVVGQAARLLNLDPELTTIYYLQNMMSNLAMISARLVPLSVLDVNAMLLQMQPDIASIAGEVQDCGIEDISTATILIDLASLSHETQGVRLCKS